MADSTIFVKIFVYSMTGIQLPLWTGYFDDVRYTITKLSMMKNYGKFFMNLAYFQNAGFALLHYSICNVYKFVGFPELNRSVLVRWLDVVSFTMFTFCGFFLHEFTVSNKNADIK